MERSEVGYGEPGRPCGTSLVFARNIYQRILVNREPELKVSRHLGIARDSTRRIVRMLKHCGGVPSLERLATIAMRIPDAEDGDIADWFGKPLAWARQVRECAGELRVLENIPPEYESLPDETGEDLPSAEERAERAAELRRRGLALPQGEQPRHVTAAQYSWNSRNGTFVSVGA